MQNFKWSQKIFSNFFKNNFFLILKIKILIETRLTFPSSVLHTKKHQNRLFEYLFLGAPKNEKKISASSINFANVAFCIFFNAVGCLLLSKDLRTKGIKITPARESCGRTKLYSQFYSIQSSFCTCDLGICWTWRILFGFEDCRHGINTPLYATIRSQALVKCEPNCNSFHLVFLFPLIVARSLTLINEFLFFSAFKLTVTHFRMIVTFIENGRWAFHGRK